MKKSFCLLLVLLFLFPASCFASDSLALQAAKRVMGLSQTSQSDSTVSRKVFSICADLDQFSDLEILTLYASLSAQIDKRHLSVSSTSSSTKTNLSSPSESDLLSCKVAGVTFANPDGTERQKTLASFYRSNGGPGSGTGRLSRYTYEGSPAVYVLLNNKIIGNIPAEEVDSVLSIYDDIDDVSIYVGRFTTDEGELIYFARANIEY